MSQRQIEIQDILLQGRRGPYSEFKMSYAPIGAVVRVDEDPNGSNFRMKGNLIQFNRTMVDKGCKDCKFILLYRGNFYLYDPVFYLGAINQIQSTPENESERNALTFFVVESGGVRLVDDEVQSICESLMKKSGRQPSPSPNVVSDICTLIQAMAYHADEFHELDCITRIISDEFTFYPAQCPITLEEYKRIIEITEEIVIALPPDIHLVLATFPVIWKPNDAIQNCGLYVVSPKGSGDRPLIYHFHKSKLSFSDISYLDNEGKVYALGADPKYSIGIPVDEALGDSPLAIDDVNQCGSALKLTTSRGQSFIVTLGICVEHLYGLERDQTHALIEQLQRAGQSVPLHCSHVITSSSIAEIKKHTISTISHADSHEKFRFPAEFPTRTGFTPYEIKSEFARETSTEVFPKKPIGTLHSDLFQHAAAGRSPQAVADELNTPELQTGRTMLHEVFLETDYDRELIARRLYAMIIHGGDPDIQDYSGQSVRDIANEKEQSESNKIICKAIDSALQWRSIVLKQNEISPTDNCTPLTRLARQFNQDEFYRLIVSGANPYLRDGNHQSFFELIESLPQYNATLREQIKNLIRGIFHAMQYGYQQDISNIRFNTRNHPTFKHVYVERNTESWFDEPPPPEAPVKTSEQNAAPQQTFADYKEGYKEITGSQDDEPSQGKKFT